MNKVDQGLLLISSMPVSGSLKPSSTWKNTVKLQGDQGSSTVVQLSSFRSPGEKRARHIVTYHQFSDCFALSENYFRAVRNDSNSIILDTQVGSPLLDLRLESLDDEVMGNTPVSLEKLDKLSNSREYISSHAIKAINLSFYLRSLFKTRLNINIGVEVTRPIIAEVGPGVGLLPFNLMQRFERKAKYYLIDIPETLQLSFYLLSVAFPELRHVVLNDKTSQSIIECADFVYVTPDNAFLITDDIDFAINCNSFGEMTAEVSNAYIKLLTERLRENGFLYLSNIFGADSESVRAPSEYAISKDLSLIFALGSSYYEYAGPNYLFFDCCFKKRVLQNGTGSILTRLKLRILNSCLQLSVSALEDAFVGDVVQAKCLDELSKLCDERFLGSGLKLSGNEFLEGLIDKPLFALSDVEILSLKYPNHHERSLLPEVSVRLFQSKLSVFFRTQTECEVQTNAYTEFLALLKNLHSTRAGHGPFYTAYLSSVALALGLKDISHSLLSSINTSSPYWNLRFAYLAERSYLPDLHTHFLSKINPDSLDLRFQPMFFNLFYSCKLDNIDNFYLESFVEKCLVLRVTEPLLAVLGTIRIVAKGEHWANELLEKIFKFFVENQIMFSSDENFYALKDFLVEPSEIKVPRLIDLLLSLSHNREGLSEFDRLEIANIHTSVKNLDKCAEEVFKLSYTNYYALGSLVPRFLRLELNDLALKAANHSLSLRPNTSKHSYFLGCEFFKIGRFAEARVFFEHAKLASQEDIISDGYFSFLSFFLKNGANCCLDPKSLHLIYQRDQGFYFPRGPVNH